ncbi:hypothetical protein PGT21_019373 [Puccinia graminis f. sp. tritici]|uniref:Uncharacterized protein n=1 Tax=Puccinia graminis f. sp. tritici TaxID=56615 RepID=A0A5B0MDL2_PUCGR|nr:hypothetical protein PGT21_019373 [Puccinia graminis f. sp. tritici]
MSHLQVAKGHKLQRTNKFQSFAKAKAEEYSPTIMSLLGINVVKHHGHCKCSSPLTHLPTPASTFIFADMKKAPPENAVTLIVALASTSFATEPGGTTAGPDLTSWVADTLVIRRETVQPEEARAQQSAANVADNAKRRRTLSRAKCQMTTTTTSSVLATAPASTTLPADNDKPLMTQEDIDRLVQQRNAPLDSVGWSAFRTTCTLGAMSEAETARIGNLT